MSSAMVDILLKVQIFSNLYTNLQYRSAQLFLRLLRQEPNGLAVLYGHLNLDEDLQLLPRTWPIQTCLDEALLIAELAEFAEQQETEFDWWGLRNPTLISHQKPFPNSPTSLTHFPNSPKSSVSCFSISNSPLPFHYPDGTCRYKRKRIITISGNFQQAAEPSTRSPALSEKKSDEGMPQLQITKDEVHQ